MIQRLTTGKHSLDRYVVLGLLCLFAVVWITPLAIVVLSSMKTPIEQSQSGNPGAARECRNDPRQHFVRFRIGRHRQRDYEQSHFTHSSAL